MMARSRLTSDEDVEAAAGGGARVVGDGVDVGIAAPGQHLA